MYGIFNPLTGQTERARTNKRAVRRVLQLAKENYKDYNIKRVLVHHYTGTKILFDNDRLQLSLENLLESYKKGDYKQEMTVMMIDCFYRNEKTSTGS